MNTANTSRKFGGAIALLVVVVSSLAAQAPPTRDMADLVATLKEPGITTARKQGLVRGVFSGTVEVREVQPVTPSKERPWDSLPSDQPAMRILADVGIANPSWFVLAFQTTDVDRAAKLRKGDNVKLSGRLVQFVLHKRGYNETTDDEWLLFDQVVIGAK